MESCDFKVALTHSSPAVEEEVDCLWIRLIHDCYDEVLPRITFINFFENTTQKKPVKYSYVELFSYMPF